MSNLDPSYKLWISELKQKVRSAQLKAAVAVVGQLASIQEKPRVQRTVAQFETRVQNTTSQQPFSQTPWGHNI